MANISIVVDGKPQSIDSEIKPTQIFAENTEIIVCKVNGDLKDLWTDLKDGDVVEGISIESPDGLAVLRHSTAIMTLTHSGHSIQMILRNLNLQCARLLSQDKDLSVVLQQRKRHLLNWRTNHTSAN